MYHVRVLEVRSLKWSLWAKDKVVEGFHSFLEALEDDLSPCFSGF